MQVLRKIALISGQDVFGTIGVNVVKTPELWEGWQSVTDIVAIPDGLAFVHKGWKYNGSEFLQPENSEDLISKPEEFGNLGWAFVSNDNVFASIYPNETFEIGSRYLAGLSSDPKAVVIPEGVSVFPGDTWDGSEFHAGSN